MLKIQYISDVHGQYHFVKHEPEADVLVVAGDWSEGVPNLSFFKKWPVPVIFVMGNHEAYGHDIEYAIDNIREQAAAPDSNVHFLEKDVLEYKGVRFIGCTGWTDMVDKHPWMIFKSWRGMSDYRKIGAENWFKDAVHEEYFRKEYDTLPKHGYSYPYLHPLITYYKHKEAKQFLDTALSKPFDGPTVVITHHPPTPVALRHTGFWIPEYEQGMDFSLLETAFPKYGWQRLGTHAGRMDDIIEKHRPTLWLHGHLHRRTRYFRYDVPVFSNAIGYNHKERPANAIIDLNNIPWHQKKLSAGYLTHIHAKWIDTWVLKEGFTNTAIKKESWAPYMWKLHRATLDEIEDLAGIIPDPSVIEDSLTENYWTYQAINLRKSLKDNFPEQS